MVNNRIRALVVAGSLAFVLAACGDGNRSPTTPPVVTPPPTPVVTPQSNFGSCFATRFDAAPNTKATDPVPCPDLAPLTLVAKPIAL